MIILRGYDDLVKRGLNAGEIVKTAAAVMGGSGGGRPHTWLRLAGKTLTNSMKP
jgi:alanyl-tRNA synthetase